MSTQENKLQIKIHRGTHQIGGCATEISFNDTKILIDLGANLPGCDGLSDEKLLNRVFGRKRTKTYAAILFSHYHGDHIGLYKQIPEKQQECMYIGGIAKEILKIITGITDREEGFPIIEKMKEYPSSGPVFDNGEMKVTPIRVDHSALDAYMFLIEADGQKILFTGDFREHGILGSDGKLWSKIDEIGKVDILITEGTMLSRIEETKLNIVESEADLGKKAGEIFASKPYNFVVVSSTNLDSVMEFYHNTPANRFFICDAYQAAVISAAAEHLYSQHDKYQGKEERGNYTKHIQLLGRILSRDFAGLNQTASRILKDGGKPIFFDRNKMSPEQLQKGFVMLVRPNRYPERGQSRFEEQWEYFTTNYPDQVNIVYSMWDGYLTGKHKDRDLIRLIGDKLEPQHLHTSGHAYVETIAKLMDKVSARLVIPMHTEMAGSFSKMKIFEKYKDTIRELHDGEELVIVDGKLKERTFEFRRKTDYSKEVLEEIKELQKTYPDLLMMPNEGGFIGYYKGIVLLENVTQTSFKIKDEKSDIEGRDKKAMLQRRADFLSKFMKKDYFERITGDYVNKMPTDRERRSSQIIALKNMSFELDEYSVCGWETTVSLNDLYDIGKDGAPEIDMILVNPKEETILLVEYKCVGESMLRGNQDLAHHYSDYNAILGSKAFEHIKTELLKAYKLLYEMKHEGQSFDYESISWKTKIGFLFVDQVCVDGREARITEADYAEVFKKPEFVKALNQENLVYIRAKKLEDLEKLDSWRQTRDSGLAVTC